MRRKVLRMSSNLRGVLVKGSAFLFLTAQVGAKQYEEGVILYNVFSLYVFPSAVCHIRKAGREGPASISELAEEVTPPQKSSRQLHPNSVLSV
jgi:hypothetical protein